MQTAYRQRQVYLLWPGTLKTITTGLARDAIHFNTERIMTVASAQPTPLRLQHDHHPPKRKYTADVSYSTQSPATHPREEISPRMIKKTRRKPVSAQSLRCSSLFQRGLMSASKDSIAFIARTEDV